MKTLFKSTFLTWAVRGVWIAIYSCLVSVALAQAQSSLTLEDELQARCIQAGIDHNKGLDYVFNYLKKSGQLKTQKDFFDVAEQATIEYMKTTPYSENKNQKRELESLIHSEFRQMSTEGKKHIGQNLSANVLSKMTAGQKEIMADVFTVTNDLGIDLQSSLDRLDSIEVRAKGICDREELFLILSAISVGKHSMQYWHDNYEKWMIELGSAEGLASQTDEPKVTLSSDTTHTPSAKKGKDKKGKKGKKGWFHWKKVVGMDIAGAVGGAVYSGIVNPFSWGIVGIASLGLSVGEALYEVLDRLL